MNVGRVSVGGSVGGMDSLTKLGRWGFGVNWEWVGCFYGEDGIFIIFYISCCRYGIYFIVCDRCDSEHMYYINGLKFVN